MSRLSTFYEFIDGEKAKGLGASHQTGWTGLVAMLLQQSGKQSEGDPMGISSAGYRKTMPLDNKPPDQK